MRRLIHSISMRFLRCVPQVATAIASALFWSGPLLFAEANGPNGHYSVDDIIRKQDEVAAFEETLRKVDALIKKNRRGGGDSLPLQENRAKKDGLEILSIEGEGRQLEGRKLNPKKEKKKAKTSKKEKAPSSLQNEMNQCLDRVESLEKKIDEMKKDPNKDEEISYLYVQESEKCEVTREKSSNGKTSWKIESSNLNRITFRYSSIPYRLAWKEPSYLFALGFTSIFGNDGPNAALTSGGETVVFFINNVEYEFDEETQTSKQVYEIEQSKEQEEISPLSNLLGETTDGKTFEHCKYFIDDGGSGNLISDGARFYKIQNTLASKVPQIQEEEDTAPATPSSSPSALGITGYSAASFMASQSTAVGNLVQACVDNNSNGCDTHTISQTTGNFLLGAAGVLAVAFPPTAAVLAMFGTVAELIGIFSPSSTPATNELLKELERQQLIDEISNVVTDDINSNDIELSKMNVNTEAINLDAFTSSNYLALHQIQSTNDQTTIDSYVDSFYSEQFKSAFNSEVPALSSAINEFIQTANFETTFDNINTWLGSINDGGACSFPIWPNIGKCNGYLQNAHTEYNEVVEALPVYLKGLMIFVKFTSLSLGILFSHSSCAAGFEDCKYYGNMNTLWEMQRNSVTLRSHGIKKAIETLKTCGNNPNNINPNPCTVCDGTHPFDQTCNANGSGCTYQYLTISGHSDIENYASNAQEVYVGVYESDAENDCQNFVNSAGNPFNGGISATASTAFFKENCERLDNEGEFGVCSFSGCSDVAQYQEFSPPGGTFQQINVGNDVWCVAPPAPNQQDCGTLADFLDDVICPACDFAVYALKGYSLNPKGGDSAAITACQNAIMNQDVFSPWPLC